MNIRIRNLIIMIIGLPVFLGIWLYNMFSGVTLLIGFGFGILMFNWFNGLFKNWQRSVYLSEKADMVHKKLELERELEKLKDEV